MSRHRAVRNLDLDDELDDSPLDEGLDADYPGITPEQQEQMAAGLVNVRAVLGSASGVSDKEIKDSLWYYYFDDEKTVSYLLDQQHKKAAAKEKAAQRKQAQSGASTPATRPGTPTGGTAPKKKVPVVSAAAATIASAAKNASAAPAEGKQLSQVQQDLKNMGLDDEEAYVKEDVSTLPIVSIAKEKILADLREKEKQEGYKPVLSMVVVGHVDAGKSTLMGRMLAELGEMSERAVNNNQRQSEKVGKGSFAYAWAFDALPEERARGVTIDVGIDSFSTPHRRFTLIDAPGHRDFIPNMISGASQADTALLVVDASIGAFESGFNEGGQTREHALLVRSFGVQQLVVAVNKLDAVGWSQERFDQIVDTLQPFLVQAGFSQSKLTFIPCGAMLGENLVQRQAEGLSWYTGQTIIQRLDTLSVPDRALEAPLRIPVSNVFRGQTSGPSGLGVSGRIESGIVQLGERLAVLPGDESGVVRNIEVDGETVDYAVAGSNVTIYLAAIDPIYVNLGCVLCEQRSPIPLASTITAQIVTFELKFPLTAGSAVELFHHSKDTPATIAKIEATLDKATGEVLKTNPRMVSRGASARVQIKLRASGSSSKRNTVPIETFAANKSMGRVLLRRGGETVAAGIVLEIA